MIDTLTLARDRLEAPLFGETAPEHPFLILGLTLVLAFFWVRILSHME